MVSVGRRGVVPYLASHYRMPLLDALMLREGARHSHYAACGIKAKAGQK